MTPPSWLAIEIEHERASCSVGHWKLLLTEYTMPMMEKRTDATKKTLVILYYVEV